MKAIKLITLVLCGLFAYNVAEANAGKAALKTVSVLSKKLKPAPAAKIVQPVAQTSIAPAFVPAAASAVKTTQSCWTCGGGGCVFCTACNINGQVFVTSGFDMFGNPIGTWKLCPYCSGSKKRACPSCR